MTSVTSAARSASYRPALATTAFVLAQLLLGCDRGTPGSSAAHGDWTTADQKSLDHFKRTVIPLLEERCGISCHGVTEKQYAAWMNNSSNATYFYFPIDPKTGRLSVDPELQRMAFNVARGKWHPKDQAKDDHAEPVLRIDYQTTPDFGHLLLAPLSTAAGGSLVHHGYDVFTDTNDPGYRVLSEWMAEEIKNHPENPPARSTAEAFFGAEVVGVLERNSCFTASCHGANVFNDLKLIKPLPRLPNADPDAPARLSPRMLDANRKQLLGQVSRFVNLGGDLQLSRSLVKNLPITQGGVHQRGGNRQFFSGMNDPDVAILLRWMQMEKDAVAKRLTSGGRPIPAGELGREKGIAFLRGPRHAPRRYWNFDDFYPGTELMLLPTGGDAPTALVSELGVEIQALDVRYDARAIVFSMRKSAEQGFRVWQLELTDSLHLQPDSLRQITFGPERTSDGTLIHHVDPSYLPEWGASPDAERDAALDRVAIAYAANTSGAYSQSEQWALLGEADEGDSQRAVVVDARHYEAAGTFTGRRIHIVAGPMKAETRTIRRHLAGGRFELDRPLPEAVDARTVFVIEQQEPRFDPSYDIWRVMPGRWDSNRKMTYTNAQERRPTVRTTGEVMFTSVRNRNWMDDKPVFNGAIFRAQAGGWDYHIHGGNRSGYPLYHDSRELPQGLEIRLAMDPRNYWNAGNLILADHGFGVHIEPDNPVDNLTVTRDGGRPASGSQRYLPAQYPVLPEYGPHGVTNTGVSPGGSFRDPFPVSDGSVLVARASRELDHLSSSADPDWDVYRLRWTNNQLQSEDGQSAGPVELERISAASTSAAAEFNPRPVMVRLKEKSNTHQKFAPRTDGLEPKAVDGVLRLSDESLPGEIECYDFPLVQAFFENFVPVDQPRNFRDGELRYVRIVRQLPSSASDVQRVAMTGQDVDPFARPIALGIGERQQIVAEVPLEPDGSFYAQVPSNVPLIVQGLNADRMAVISEARYFFVQPGEKLTFSIPRSVYTTRCSGCHAALTGDRVEAIGPTDLVTAASLVMATWNEGDHTRRQPFRAQPMTIDFRGDIEPILEARCVECHGKSRQIAGNLDLRNAANGPWTVAYRSLHRLEEPGSGNFSAKRYIDERSGLASRSYLIEKLTGHEYRAPQQLNTPGQKHVADLSNDELLTLIRWIDLGATFQGGTK